MTKWVEILTMFSIIAFFIVFFMGYEEHAMLIAGIVAYLLLILLIISMGEAYVDSRRR